MPASVINKFTNSLLVFYKTEDELTDILKKTERILRLWKKNQELNDFFKDPSIHLKSKKEIFSKILKNFNLDKYFLNCINIMIDYQLYENFNYFLTSFRELIMDKLNLKYIYVETSLELDKNQKNKLENILKKKIKKNLIFKYKIDKALIMGIKIKYENYVEEFSVISQLNEIKKQLKKHLI